MGIKIPQNYVIKSIEIAEKNPKMIQNWIENLSSLHKETSSSSVFYTKKMPEIESLMQVNIFFIEIKKYFF